MSLIMGTKSLVASLQAQINAISGGTPESTNIHVNLITGLDSNDGAMGSPVATVGHALSLASTAGVAIHVTGNNGTPIASLTIGATMPAIVILNGVSTNDFTYIQNLTISATAGTVVLKNLKIDNFTCSANAILVNCKITTTIGLSANNTKVTFDDVNYGFAYPLQVGETSTTAPFHGASATFNLNAGSGTGFLRLLPNCSGAQVTGSAANKWIVQSPVAFENSAIDSSNGTIGSDGLLDATSYSKILWSSSLLIMSDGSISSTGAVVPGGNLTSVVNGNVVPPIPSNPTIPFASLSPNLGSFPNTYFYYAGLPKYIQMMSYLLSTKNAIFFLPNLASDPNKPSSDYDKDVYIISNNAGSVDNTTSASNDLNVLTTGFQAPNGILSTNPIMMINLNNSSTSIIKITAGTSITMRWSNSRQVWQQEF